MLSPDQVEEAVIKDFLLQRASQMFIGIDEEKRKCNEALMALLDAAFQHRMAPGCAERLREFVLEGYPGAFECALCGDPLHESSQ